MTARQVAALIDMPIMTFHKAMMRERQRGRDYRLPRDQWIDARTPLYDTRAVQAWAEGRKKR
jgi:hypothetical protein